MTTFHPRRHERDSGSSSPSLTSISQLPEFMQHEEEDIMEAGPSNMSQRQRNTVDTAIARASEDPPSSYLTPLSSLRSNEAQPSPSQSRVPNEAAVPSSSLTQLNSLEGTQGTKGESDVSNKLSVPSSSLTPLPSQKDKSAIAGPGLNGIVPPKSLVERLREQARAAALAADEVEEEEQRRDQATKSRYDDAELDEESDDGLGSMPSLSRRRSRSVKTRSPSPSQRQRSLSKQPSEEGAVGHGSDEESHSPSKRARRSTAKQGKYRFKPSLNKGSTSNLKPPPKAAEKTNLTARTATSKISIEALMKEKMRYQRKGLDINALDKFHEEMSQLDRDLPEIDVKAAAKKLDDAYLARAREGLYDSDDSQRSDDDAVSEIASVDLPRMDDIDNDTQHRDKQQQQQQQQQPQMDREAILRALRSAAGEGGKVVRDHGSESEDEEEITEEVATILARESGVADVQRAKNGRGGTDFDEWSHHAFDFWCNPGFALSQGYAGGSEESFWDLVSRLGARLPQGLAERRLGGRPSKFAEAKGAAMLSTFERRLLMGQVLASAQDEIRSKTTDCSIVSDVLRTLHLMSCDERTQGFVSNAQIEDVMEECLQRLTEKDANMKELNVLVQTVPRPSTQLRERWDDAGHLSSWQGALIKLNRFPSRSLISRTLRRHRAYCVFLGDSAAPDMVSPVLPDLKRLSETLESNDRQVNPLWIPTSGMQQYRFNYQELAARVGLLSIVLSDLVLQLCEPIPSSDADAERHRLMFPESKLVSDNVPKSFSIGIQPWASDVSLWKTLALPPLEATAQPHKKRVRQMERIIESLRVAYSRISEGRRPVNTRAHRDRANAHEDSDASDAEDQAVGNDPIWRAKAKDAVQRLILMLHFQCEMLLGYRLGAEVWDDRIDTGNDDEHEEGEGSGEAVKRSKVRATGPRASDQRSMRDFLA